VLGTRVYIGQACTAPEPIPASTERSSTAPPGTRSSPSPAESLRHGASRTRAVKPVVLKGLILGPDDLAMAPSHTRRRGRLYRFYSLKLCHGELPIRAVPAGEVEAAVVNHIRTLLRSPEIVGRVWRAAHRDREAIDK
jgi:site-specific DNA recombinase